MCRLNERFFGVPLWYAALVGLGKGLAKNLVCRLGGPSWCAALVGDFGGVVLVGPSW